MVLNTPIVWPVWVSRCGCAPSQLLVKINLFLAEPRTAPQPSPHLLIQGCYSFLLGAFFNLPFLVDIPVEALVVILYIPCQVSSSCTLAFLTSSPHNWAASLYSSQDTCPCFHCLRSLLLPFSLTSRSRFSHAGLFPSFPDFLHLGTESSCALWKVSLKIYQLCSAPLSLRTIS